MELPFTTTTVSDLQKAWHIFSLLLSTGRPLQPPELSSKCTLFHSSPELIEFLCFIPNSPLHLTSNYLVTFSQIGFVATFNFFANANAVYPAFVPQLEQRRDTECMTGPYYRKRKRITRSEVENSPVVKRRGVFNNFDGEEGSEVVLTLPSINQRNYAQAYLPKSNLSCGMNHLTRISLTLACDLNGFYEMFKTPWKVGLSARPSSSGLKSIEYECENKIDRGESNSEANTVHIPICKSDIFRQSVFNSPQLMPLYTSSLETISASNVAEMVDTTEKKVNSDTNSCTKEDNEMKIQLPEADALVHGFENMIHKENFVEGNEDPTSSHVSNRNINYTKAHPALVYKSPGGIPKKKNIGAILANMQLHRKLPGKSAPTSKPFQREVLDQGEQNINKALKNHNAASLLIREHLFRDPKLIPTKQKNKQKFDLGISFKERKGNPKENGENFACNSTKESSEQKKLPNFESYIMEEEEGSGGYGTVYRARRKSDEVKFAIKCPHPNANKQHVHNELKMLERFGGKNFVIKYEGSFKDGDSDCLVLEHVEHDRPEILKRDIDVYQLQWYGYCMFRALAGLHKQGIVHRDVKPGNFLFSRKVNKGYLIDFNLALDLHQKYGTSDKTKVSNATSFNNSLPKSLPPIKQRKYSTAKLEEGINEEASKGTKPLLRLKNLKRKADQEKVGTSIAYRSIIKSQGADGSGITSTKDATSNRTPSAERLREPVPCQGRKELINLVQEALNGSSPGETNGPTSKRKRVAATPGKAESKYFYITPMPLHSSGIGIGGAGLLKSKGEGKHKREGPCVGTKGFRAPEVLFRSLHQGPKLDIWSAGVTLLYFIIGRTPFAGDPDQNIKEIAKLRGTEDLWEVAKLNNRESSFPPDLFDLKFLSPVKLRDWCRQNSKKPGFLEVMPQSLVDLVDKCLTVNPRLRISAEEALRHEFFAPCHEALRKHRLYRQGINQGSQEAGSTLSLPKKSQTCGVL